MFENAFFRVGPHRHAALLLGALTLAACGGTVGPQTRLAPAPASYFTVSVQKGDSLSTLAARYRVEEDDLLALNEIHDRNRLPPGTSLRVPAYASLSRPREERAVASSPSRVASAVPLPKPRPGQARPAPARQPAPQASWTDMGWLSSFSSESPDPAAPAVTFLWPVQGRVISNFGSTMSGERNDGIDISASRGEPVRAAADGTVSYVGDELKGYGNLVLIRHQNGYVTAYAHSDAVAVERGQRVTAGQIIAYAGATGDVSQPQVHFELRVGTRPVDPKLYLAASK